MIPLHIITEGVADGTLLLRGLEERIPRLRKSRDLLDVRAAKSKDAALNLVRSTLVVTQHPVALVIDADTLIPELIASERTGLESALRFVAPPERWRIYLAKPEIEICLFDDPSAVEKLLGRTLTSDELARAKQAPKSFLWEQRHFMPSLAGLNIKSENELLLLLLNDKDVVRSAARSALVTDLSQYVLDVFPSIDVAA